MNTYERVTYRPEGERARSIYLHRPVESGPFLIGTEVNREGDEIASKGFDERRHLIDLELVIRRVPMRMDMYYGELVKDEVCTCCGDDLELHTDQQPCCRKDANR